MRREEPGRKSSTEMMLVVQRVEGAEKGWQPRKIGEDSPLRDRVLGKSEIEHYRSVRREPSLLSNGRKGRKILEPR